MDNIDEILAAEADDENSSNGSTLENIIVQNEERPLLSSLRRRNLKNDAYKEGALNFLSSKYEVDVHILITVFITLLNIVRLLERHMLSS